MDKALWEGNYHLVPIETSLPTPDGRLVTVWKGLEIREVQVAAGTSTRRGGILRKTYQIWARDDSYSQGYWVIPYWGKFVEEARWHNRVTKSETTYWVGEYPIGCFEYVAEDGETYKVYQYGCIDGRPSDWPGNYLANLGPHLDEATDAPPLFRIVALEDGQVSILDEKVSQEGGWDCSYSSVGNRYVLCCEKDALKKGILWTTHYHWGERKDCDWKPYHFGPGHQGVEPEVFKERMSRGKKRKRLKLANLQGSTGASKSKKAANKETATDTPERVSPLTLTPTHLGSSRKRITRSSLSQIH